MGFFLVLFLLVALHAKSDLSCSSFPCLSKWRSNGRCDLACMNPLCGFDSSLNFNSSVFDLVSNSDCIKFDNSLNSCDHSLLGNGQCDQACNLKQYGWDFGDCSFCGESCTLDMLKNDICDPECDNFYCASDNGNCKSAICGTGCTIDLFQTDCYKECTVADCKDYVTPCDEICGNDCYLKDIVDNVCTTKCLTESCNYDNGACDCAPECNLGRLNNEECLGPDDPCNNPECKYKNGKCGDCSFWCFNYNLGDGRCDWYCNVAECDYDLGDCGCAPGCSLIYWRGQWWNIQQNYGNLNCYVPQCLYNNKNPYDYLYLKAVILTQIISSNFINTRNQLTEGNLGDCTTENLKKFNYLNLCKVNSPCYTESALWCLGKSENFFYKCLHSSNIKCLVNVGLVYMGTLLTNQNNCPNNFIEAKEISALFYENENNFAKWCFVDPTHYTMKYPKYHFVKSSSEALSLGSGTVSDPFLSLYYAFTQVYHRYTKIILFEGIHFYKIDKSLVVYLRKNIFDPLNVNLGYKLKLLQIEGANPYNRSKVYWKDSLIISSPANKIEFKHIEFIGDYLIREDCDGSKDICYYCPFYNKELNLNENYEKVSEEDKTYYMNDCQKFAYDDFFVFDSPAHFENIKFNNIRNKFNSLIKTSSTLTLLFVHLLKIQAKSDGYIIMQECISNCKEVDFTLVNSGIELINYGYRFTFFINTGNFLKISNIRSVNIESCYFYNILIYGSGDEASLKYFMDINTYNGTVKIADNYFDSLVVDNFIIVNNENCKYEDFSSGSVPFYDQIHFLMNQNIIFKVFVFRYFFYYTFKNIPHNIMVTNLIGIKMLLYGPLIRIESKSGLHKGLRNFYRLLYIHLEEIYVSGDLIKTLDLEYFEIDFFYLKTLEYVQVKESFIDSILRKNGQADNGKFPDFYILKFNAIKIFFIQYSSYVFLTNIELLNISQNEFELDIGIFILHLYHLEIRNVIIKDFSFLGQASGLISVSDVYYTKITNVLIKDSQNAVQIIYLNKSTFFLIESLNLENCISYLNSPVVFYDIGFIDFFSSSLVNTTTLKGRSGGLEILINLDYSLYIYNIKDIIFQGCSGGFMACCLLIDSYSIQKDFNLKLNNTIYLNSRSISSPVIFISNSIRFDNNSFIVNTKFVNNTVLSNSLLKISLLGSLFLNNWSFQNNTSSNVIILELNADTEEFNLEDFTLLNNTVYSSGISIQGSNNKRPLIINNMTIENLKKPFGNTLATAFFSSNVDIKMSEINVSFVSNFISINQASLFEITNCNCFNLTDDAILVNKDSFLILNYCQFFYNQGSIILVMKDSSIALNNCKIFQNVYSGIEYALIKLESFNYNLVNLINNTEIFNNTSKNTDLIKIYNTIIKATNLKFYSNQVFTEGKHEILLLNSDLILESSNFTNEILSGSSSIIYSISNSKITFYSSSIQNSQSLIGGLINVLDSYLTVEYCNFTRNSGQCIKSENSEILVSFSSFTQNSAETGMNMHIKSSTLKILSSNFSLFTSSVKYSSSLILINSQVSISHSTFQESIGSVSAIFSQDCSEILINFCFFNNIFSREMSAVYFEGITIFGINKVENSVFINNTSGYNGGALSVKNNNLNLLDTIIEKNHAYLNGGGIFIQISICINCQIYLISVLVKENIANLQGGGLMWFGSKPIISNNTLFSSNSAECGKDMASQVVKIQLLDDLPFIGEFPVIQNAPSGQIYKGKVRFGLFDSYNTLVTTDNSSILNIKLPSYNEFSIIGSLSFYAEKGIFTVTGFTISSSPGKLIFFELLSPSIPINPAINDNSSYVSNLILRVQLRNCTNGEQILENSCKICGNSTFLLKPAKDCLPCPTGGICPGGDKIFVKPGYYRTSDKSKIIYSCDFPDACLGNDKDYNTSCLTGYSGIKCFVCETDYSKITLTNCVKCPSQETNFFVILSTIFGVIIISFFIIKASIKSVYSPQSKHSIYLKILTNYLHLLSLLVEFNFKWHKYVQAVFKAHQSLTMIGASFFSFDCYLIHEGVKNKEVLYYTKLEIMIFFPAGVFLISFIIWFGVCLLKETYEFLKKELILTMNILFFIIYPSVIKILFSHFGCQNLDIIGQYISSDLAVKCWDLKYKRVTYLLVLPGIIIWAVGLPTIILLIMIKKRNEMHKEYNKFTLGYLFNGYKKSSFYWEFLNIYRKLLIVSILVFVDKDLRIVQALTLFSVLLISAVLHFKIKPYNSKELNKLEIFSLSTGLITNLCGLFYLSEGLTESVKHFLFATILFFNFLFLAYWSYLFFIVFYRLLLQKFSFLRKYSKLDAFDSEFYVEEISHPGKYIDKDENIKMFTLFKRPAENIERFKVKNLSNLYKQVLMYELQIDVNELEPQEDEFIVNSLDSNE